MPKAGSRRFVDGKTLIPHDYPSGYTGPKPIETQIEILRSHFPLLKPESALRFMTNIYPRLKFPRYIEGAFVVPNERALLKLYASDTILKADHYCRSVKLILSAIQKSRSFRNWYPDHIANLYLSRREKTRQAIGRLKQLQGDSDFLIHFAQLGVTHIGRSDERARDFFSELDYGLGSFEVGSIVLSHPERFSSPDELDILCSGDTFRSQYPGIYCEVPFFDFSVNQLNYCTRRSDVAAYRLATASGYIPSEKRGG